MPPWKGIPDISEALVIGAEQDDGSYWMPLIATPADGRGLDDALVERIKASIRDLASPRHVPDQVIAVSGIPHTRTGKKLEVPVKRLLQGVPLDKVVNPGSVDRPALLLEYAAIAAARSGGPGFPRKEIGKAKASSMDGLGLDHRPNLPAVSLSVT